MTAAHLGFPQWQGLGAFSPDRRIFDARISLTTIGRVDVDDAWSRTLLPITEVFVRNAPAIVGQVEEPVVGLGVISEQVNSDLALNDPDAGDGGSQQVVVVVHGGGSCWGCCEEMEHATRFTCAREMEGWGALRVHTGLTGFVLRKVRGRWRRAQSEWGRLSPTGRAMGDLGVL